MKKIIITVFFVASICLLYMVYQGIIKYKKVSNNFTETGYNISLRYNSGNWDEEIYDEIYKEEYYGTIRLNSKRDNKNTYLTIAYNKDLHQYTKEELEYGSDTGGYEDHGEIKIINIANYKDDYIKVVEIRNQELYIKKKKDFTPSGIYLLQKVGKNSLVESMSLLNKNPKELIPRQNLNIKMIFGNRDEISEKKYRELEKEFIEIVKSIKITEIKK